MWHGINEFIKVWPAKVQIIIVNDGSNDDTESLVKQNVTYKKLESLDAIKYIVQANTGKGGAIAKGVQSVVYDFVLTLDADMATAPTELLNWLLIDPLLFNKHHIAIASRTLASSNLVLISARRKTGNIFNNIVRVLTKLPISDTQCGFKLYPTTLAKELFQNLQIKGWAHDVEILYKAFNSKITIVEMPVTWNERAASKINVWKDGLHMLWDVCKMSWRGQL